jgi:hypothetical protein
VPVEFVLREVGGMSEAAYAKTASRSVVGSMNDFAFMADVARVHGRGDDLVALSVDLADTPCGPLRKGHEFPDREVEAIVATVLGTLSRAHHRSSANGRGARMSSVASSGSNCSRS